MNTDKLLRIYNIELTSKPNPDPWPINVTMRVAAPDLLNACGTAVTELHKRNSDGGHPPANVRVIRCTEEGFLDIIAVTD